MPANENATTFSQSQEIAKNAANAAATNPNQQFNANQIIKYANGTTTGIGSQVWSNLKGQLAGYPDELSKDSATNYSLLGHVIAQQTALLANSAGLNGSDASRSLAAEQTANRDWTQDAVKTSARTMRALSTGSILFNEGVKNWTNTIAQTDPSKAQFAARDFQNQWSQVADVDAMRLYDAIKNKNDDPEGISAIVKSLGGSNSQKYKSTLNRVTAMKNLINGNQQ